MKCSLAAAAAKLLQSCLTLCNSMDCSTPDFFLHYSMVLIKTILKDHAVKVLYSICQQIWKTQQWLQDWKRSVFIPIPKKGNAKVSSNYCTIVLISHASKVTLKILQVRLQQYVNRELPDVQTMNFKMFLMLDHQKSESSRKTFSSALFIMPKPLTVWTTKNVENSSRGGNTRPPDLPLEKSVCRSGSNS